MTRLIRRGMCVAYRLAGCCVLALLLVATALHPPLGLAQSKGPAWNADEKPIATQIGGLRDLPDDLRATTTKNLALQIRKLPATSNKLLLANGLASLS